MNRIVLLFITISLSLLNLSLFLQDRKKICRKDIEGYWVIEPQKEEGDYPRHNQYPIYVIYTENREYYIFDNPEKSIENKYITGAVYGFNDSSSISSFEDFKDCGYYFFSVDSKFFGNKDYDFEGEPCGIITISLSLDKKDTIMIITYIGGQNYTIYKKIKKLPEHIEKIIKIRGLDIKKELR